MIISNIRGGLGNQMFQYAAGKTLAKKLRDDFKVDVRNFDNYRLHQGFEINRVFNCCVDISTEKDLRNILSWQSNILIQKILSYPIAKPLRKKNFIVEPHFHHWNGIKFLDKDLYLYGYWQSEKYFINEQDAIRKDFVFKESLSNANKRLAADIAKVNAVSLHVRRGDYIKNKKNSFIGSCSIDYYKKAIEIMKAKITKPIFFVFSDDLVWAKKNLPSSLGATFVEHNRKKESYNDMRLMSFCKNNIISNSTYSWWGAWLNINNNKTVIAPKKWFADKSYKVSDLIPKDWIKV